MHMKHLKQRLKHDDKHICASDIAYAANTSYTYLFTCANALLFHTVNLTHESDDGT